MLKGPSGNHFTLKAGSAQSGSLSTMWDGTRPSPSYSPKKLQGAIILGTGGDGSHSGTGTFFEGAITTARLPIRWTTPFKPTSSPRVTGDEARRHCAPDGVQIDEPLSRFGAVCRAFATMFKRLPRVSLVLVAGANRRDVSDAELAHGLATGEAWAVGLAWHRFAPMVLNMAERSLGSRPDAEDLAQDVFLNVFRTAKTVREPEKLRSFVYSVAIFALKSELRRRKLRSWLSLLTPEALVEIGSKSVDMESRDLLRRFYALLDRLSARDRLVFSLRELESMTVEEIAEVMNLSVSTVKRSLAHAMTRLSRWIMADSDLADVFDTRRWQR